MAKMICTACGAIGRPKKKVRGSLLVEICLWLLFIIPGLIYSIVRSMSYQKVCGTCGQNTLVPLDSPRGYELAAKYGYDD